MIFPEKASAGPRTRVKICGLTDPDDAALAVELGADALGLNFYPRSPRCLDPARDAAWLRALPPGVPRVAVVVNASRAEIVRLLGGGLADAVQLHGDEDAAFCAGLRADRIPFIKAVRARDASVLDDAVFLRAEHLLVDAYQPGAYGGTGHTVDWVLAARFAARHPGMILAGGLHPGNVAEAIRQVRPYAVDVASGVEGSVGPRRKAAAALRAFFAAVRGADEEAAG